MRTNAVAAACSSQPARQVEEVDRHIGRRIHRRQMLGLSQQELGVRVGVTYQQVLKYETGQNRVAAAQLYALATVLEVEIGYFYEGYGKASRRPSPPSHDRLVMELVGSFLASGSSPAGDALPADTGVGRAGCRRHGRSR